MNLRLAETRAFGNDVVLVRYQRVDAHGEEIANAQAV